MLVLFGIKSGAYCVKQPGPTWATLANSQVYFKAVAKALQEVQQVVHLTTPSKSQIKRQPTEPTEPLKEPPSEGITLLSC